jgi:hypothetical protein
LLLQGNFKSALSEIRWRWRSEGVTAPYPSELTLLPPNHEELTLWSEQGLGDQLLMISLLSHPSLTGRSLCVQVDDRLIPLVHPHFPEIHWVGRSQQLIPTVSGSMLSLLELPCLLLDSLNSLSKARSTSWLAPQSAEVDPANACTRLSPDACTIGISWSSANPVLGFDKSIPIECFVHGLSASITRNSEFMFVDLQYGELLAERDCLGSRLGGNYIDASDIDKTNDLLALASLMQTCRYILTVSNTVAHLAGSLGIKTWLLASPGVAGLWYWHHLDSRSFSLWYPRVRVLFKNSRVDAWSEVLDSALEEISRDYLSME